jgi:hypothetical protein
VLAAGASAGAGCSPPLRPKTKYATTARTTITSAISQPLPPPPELGELLDESAMEVLLGESYQSTPIDAQRVIVC